MNYNTITAILRKLYSDAYHTWTRGIVRVGTFQKILIVLVGLLNFKLDARVATFHMRNEEN